MRSHRNIPVYLLVILALVCRASVEAKPLLTVMCDDPQGTEMSYGRGLLELRDLTVDTSSVEYPGVRPRFLIEDDKPQTLLVTWDNPHAQPEPSSTPDKTFAATILSATDDQITAVHRTSEAVWMYSLFPKLGIGYFSTHNHIPLGYTSRSVSTYAMCHFARGNG